MISRSGRVVGTPLKKGKTSLVSAVIPAAGRGLRLKSRIPKALVHLGAVPLFVRTVRSLKKAYPFRKIIIVGHADDLAKMKKDVTAFGLGDITFTLGGATRAESVKKGLDRLDKKDEIVLVHDVARPFVSKKQIRQLIEEAKNKGACILAEKSTSTVKQVNRNTGVISRTLDREQIYMAQTPQVFKTHILRGAYSKLRARALRYTDEASIVEAAGHPVSILEGSRVNLKITTLDDLKIAESILTQLYEKA